jgi:signal transduction histidine kinase
MGEGDEQLVVPVRHRDEVLGCAVLEPKRADEPYFPEDQRFADAVAAQSAVALLNARAFERIRQLQELNQRTLDGLSAGVLLLTRAGSVVLWNEAARGMLAAGSGASFPATLAEAKALQPQLVGALEAALADGRARENAQLSLETPRRVFLLLSVRPLAQTGGEPLFLVLLHDLTAYKEMEATARRHEDLAKVGEMISAINHEIGNILQPVHTQLRKLDTGTAPDEVLPHALPVLKDRIGALDRLLNDLKDLARPLELRVRAVSLTDLTDSVLGDIRELPVAEGIEFHVELAANARECPADGHWLRQVLYNLVRNAAEATAGRDRREIWITSSLWGGMVCLSVRDNGPGISPLVRARLFEPFASTKGGAGTGLGLSISRKVVELHGGRIEARGEDGAGACFSVFLPQQPLPAGYPSQGRATLET